MIIYKSASIEVLVFALFTGLNSLQQILAKFWSVDKKGDMNLISYPIRSNS